jgi:hypothetical protein
MLPEHGKIDCSDCFNSDMTKQTCGQWRLDNNPCAWGSSSPRVLVLGFSKGANQTEVIQKGMFEDIAFSGVRDRLKEVLLISGLIDKDQDINSIFKSDEKEFAFGSLLRCGLSYDQYNSGKFATSGSIIAKSFKIEPTRTWINNCAQKYLVDLPSSVKVVVMLGVSNTYLTNCWDLISGIYSDAQRINEVAYIAGNKLFVHLVHPSRANGHFSDWCEKHGSVGEKRKQAISALNYIEKENIHFPDKIEERLAGCTMDKAPKIEDHIMDITSGLEGNVVGVTSKVKSVSYRASRGKFAGETCSLNRNKDGMFVVSKTRFSKDQIYVNTLDEVLVKLQSGYKVRIGSPSSLIKLESLIVEKYA